MLSIPHLVIIFLVALVVLGPDKLPEVARTMGKAMAELRRITGDFRYQVEGEMRELDRQARVREQSIQYQQPITVPPDPQLPPETPVSELAEQPPIEPTVEPTVEPSVAPTNHASAASALDRFADLPAEPPVSVDPPVTPEKPGDPHPA